MTKRLVPTFILAAAIVLGAAIHGAFAQSGGMPVILGTQTALSGCTWPTAYATITNGLAICPLNLSSGPALAIAVNGGAFTQIPMSAGTTYSATSPIVISGSTISCPTCALTTSTVASFNGRTGTVTSAVGDYSYSQLSGLPTTTGACTGGTLTGTGTVTANSSGNVSLTLTNLNATGCPF